MYKHKQTYRDSPWCIYLPLLHCIILITYKPCHKPDYNYLRVSTY